jgi:Zn-dependent protease with chaperone function
MDARSRESLERIPWSTLVMFTLGFWLSASLILDLVIVPSLFASGMMSQSGFASAGYLLFGVFNRIELVCASVVLCGFLVFSRHHNLIHLKEKSSLLLAGILLVIALIFTYWLTPQLSAWGMAAMSPWGDRALTMPPTMLTLQTGYWLLEGIKILAGVTLLRWCYRDSCRLV